MRKFLITAIVILSLLLAGIVGFIWYQSTHVFVDGRAYPLKATTLDLREEDVTESHFLAVQAQLPACQILWNVPFQGGTLSSDVQQITIETLTEEDIRILKSYFPALTRVDATACKDHNILEVLAATLQGCDVDYRVSLGGTEADPKATELTLEAGTFDFDTLMENLSHLPKLETLHFPKSDLTTSQQTALTEAYANLKITSTVEILGKEYDGSTTKLDLSALTSADVASVADKLAFLPQLREVELMDASGASGLTLEDVKQLKDAAPEAAFHYTVDFYGMSISTAETEVVLKNLKVEEDGFGQKLRSLLDVMDNCERLVLEARGQYDKIWKRITNEELAQIREDYRDKTKVVWRVYFGDNGTSLTDAQVLRAVYGLTDDNSHDLVYCENVRYLDLGHDDFLDYMPFLSGMKDLEVAILSGSPLKDLSPIAACKNLKFLEIANCLYLPNIDALKECTQLEMLNISFTTITDISVLEDLNLTHLTAVRSKIPEETLTAYGENHPDCWLVYEGDQPYGTGWRYDRDGKHLPWYAKMVTAFGYPNPYNNLGWYLKEE